MNKMKIIEKTKKTMTPLNSLCCCIKWLALALIVAMLIILLLVIVRK